MSYAKLTLTPNQERLLRRVKDEGYILRSSRVFSPTFAWIYHPTSSESTNVNAHTMRSLIQRRLILRVDDTSEDWKLNPVTLGDFMDKKPLKPKSRFLAIDFDELVKVNEELHKNLKEGPTQ